MTDVTWSLELRIDIFKRLAQALFRRSRRVGRADQRCSGLEIYHHDAVKHIDSNGAALTAINTVTLIKYLSVKGGGFMAKRVTVVRNIPLAPEKAEHIEGRISGQQIAILAEFVKRSLHSRRCDPSRC